MKLASIIISIQHHSAAPGSVQLTQQLAHTGLCEIPNANLPDIVLAYLCAVILVVFFRVVFELTHVWTPTESSSDQPVAHCQRARHLLPFCLP